MERYNDNRLLMPQIESREGLHILPEMLERYGSEIACVLIGPYDSSIMLGTPLDISSKPMLEYIRNVFDLCAKAGKSCGIFVDDASMIAAYRDMGANVYWTGTEISLLCEAFSNLCATFERETK